MARSLDRKFRNVYTGFLKCHVYAWRHTESTNCNHIIDPLSKKENRVDRLKAPQTMTDTCRHMAMCTIKFEKASRVGLAQPVRFLVVELTHPGSNPRFDMGVTFTANYSFSGRRRPRRQRDALDDQLRESQDQASSVFRKCS
jgi:hypothetical protein